LHWKPLKLTNKSKLRPKLVNYTPSAQPPDKKPSKWLLKERLCKSNNALLLNRVLASSRRNKPPKWKLHGSMARLKHPNTKKSFIKSN